MGPAECEHGAERRGLAVLCAIVALSAFDRLLIAPLLTAIARGLVASIGAVSLVVTVHFISYGFAQVGHGWLSDRIGRVRALRYALFGVALGNAVAAIAPSEVRFISLVAVPEGPAVFGFVVFFAPALQRLGSSLAVAALATGVVGLGMLVGGIVVRRLTNRLTDAHLILTGALILTAGYLLASDMARAAILAAAALAGIGQSALHSTLPRWATEAAPDARGLSTALFATGAFGGAGLAVLAGALLPERFLALFIAGAASACVAGVVAVRHRAMATSDSARTRQLAGASRAVRHPRRVVDDSAIAARLLRDALSELPDVEDLSPTPQGATNDRTC